MKEKTIKILHISDLHIQNGNMGFHNKVLDHIRKEKFSENIDYLVVSGDLGDKCEIANCKEAQKWLIKLVSALNISNDQVLFCQGNHDIQTGILEYDHSEKCYNYEIGRDYIGSPSLKKAFNQYEKINQKFGFSNASKISLTSKNDYIYETKDVRFIVINSSWLSQFNEKKMDDIKVKINTSKNKKKESSRKMFESKESSTKSSR